MTEEEHRDAVIEVYALHLLEKWKTLLNFSMAKVIARDAYEYFEEERRDAER